MSISGLLLIAAIVLFVLGAFGFRTDLTLFVGLACFAASFLPLRKGK